MTINYRELVTGQILTASPLVYYAAPALTQAAIHACSVYNPTGAPVIVSLYRVPVAGSAGNNNQIASRTVAAGATVTLHEAINHKLAPGSQLFAQGLGCSLNISGVEYIQAT